MIENEIINYLKSLPQQIKEQSLKVSNTSTEILNNQHAISEIETTIDIQVACDPSLTNDTKRKAVRKSLLADHKEYIALKTVSSELRSRQIQEEAELTFLRNEFTAMLTLAQTQAVGGYSMR